MPASYTSSCECRTLSSSSVGQWAWGSARRGAATHCCKNQWDIWASHPDQRLLMAKLPAPAAQGFRIVCYKVYNGTPFDEVRLRLLTQRPHLSGLRDKGKSY